MADPRDRVEISLPLARQVPPGSRSDPEPPTPPSAAKPYLRIWFECANQYARAQLVPDGTAYLARCPTCAKTMRFAIGPGGTSDRFFRVSC